ncbi:MAG: 2-hydroxyglutaryl-CoA dehydratase [Candidatus Firestonebacteria bacterium]|nr:2-hydroxyglutaryl-CoA dehydratase [Candidatus Firestonebacteria bacterium]
MKIYGIDLGSRKIKIACYYKNKFIKFKILDTAKFYKKFNNISTQNILNYLGIKKDDKIVTTGYGRNLLKNRGLSSISELFAHAHGAEYLTRLNSFVLLDIGAQDCKIIHVKDGNIADFLTNDKCAASTGRFLENMALILDISLEELCKHYKNPCEISSTCAVFTESELIGKISEGYKINELCAGINYAVYKKIIPLINHFKTDSIIMVGGGGLNIALKKIIENNCHIKVTVPSYPQFTGAIGCCLV